MKQFHTQRKMECAPLFPMALLDCAVNSVPMIKVVLESKNVVQMAVGILAWTPHQVRISLYLSFQSNSETVVISVSPDSFSYICRTLILFDLLSLPPIEEN